MTTEIVLYSGFGLCSIFWLLGISKKLRSDKRILIALIASVVITIIGCIIYSDNYKMTGMNASNIYFGPLIYMITYSTLRYIYKKKYNQEPTYNKSSWYDYEEGREQYWLDLVVYISPIFLSVLIPIVIS